MIQLLYLFKTFALLASLGMFWLAALWYLRHPHRLIGNFTILSLILLVRYVTVELLFIGYYSGIPHFLTYFAVGKVIDTFSFIALGYVVFLLVEDVLRLEKSVEWQFPKKTLTVGLTLILLVLRIFRWIGGLDDSSFFIATKLLLTAVGILSFVIFFRLMKRRPERSMPIERSVWQSLVLLTGLFPFGILIDELVPSVLSLYVIGEYLTPRWFSTLSVIIALLPSIFRFASTITIYRSAIAFIDVQAALAYLKRSCPLSETQEEILRYFFERGWGETVQFYGLSTLRKETRPILEKMGLRSVHQLLHMVQLDQSDGLPLA